MIQIIHPILAPPLPAQEQLIFTTMLRMKRMDDPKTSLRIVR